MQELVPLVALVLSVASLAVAILSLAVSVLNYRRDRAKVRARSDLVLHSKGPTPDSTTPMLRIRIANLGRRPVLLLNLAIAGDGQRWLLPLRDPETTKSELTVHEVVEHLERHALAQNSGIRLAEGEALDLTFWPDDCHRFICTHCDPIAMAAEIRLEDGTGRRHPVEGDSAGLKALFAAWKP